MTDAPLILALDISKTCTGIAEGRAGEKPIAYSVRGADDDVTSAVCRLGHWLIERTAVARPDWIFFEAPISPGAFIGKWDAEAGRVEMSSNPQTTIALTKMTGVVEFVAHMRGIRATAANVQTVRKNVIGSGNLKGPEAKRRVFELCKMLGWDPKNRDESDALAVWAYACMIIAPRLAPIITPMMQSRVATRIGNVEMDDVPALLKRAGTRR